MPLPKNPVKFHLPLILLLPFVIFLIFAGLDDSALQTDEGQDTFVSTTILKHGVPRHYDGINKTMPFADIYDGLFVYRTWFPYYLQALSVFLLGKTTLAARLPFAITGVLSICALYFLAFNLTQKRSIAFLSALFMAFSVPTILYFRTARYVALPILLTILLLIFYLRLYKDKDWRPLPFIATSIIFFHTMYVEFAGILLGILIHFLLHQKETDRGNLIKVAICAGTIALFTVPWLIVISPVFDKISNFYTTTSTLIDTSSTGYIKHFAAYLFQSNNYIFPFILVPLLFLAPLKTYRNQIQLLSICILTLIITSTLTSIPLYQYITAVIPLFHILLAIIVAEGIANTRVKATLALILITTNLVHIGPLLPVKALLESQGVLLNKTKYLHGVHITILREINIFSLAYKYAHELAHGFKGPLDEILAFFKTHGRPGELCYIDNEIDSFVYYTGMKAISKNELTAKSKPDWIVLRGDVLPQMEGETEKTAVALQLQQILSSNTYEKHVLKSHPNRINNAYDIQLHSFESSQENGHLLVYHLIPTQIEPVGS